MRVVLVDPSQAEAQHVTRLLEARRHEVTVFADGHQALAHIKGNPEVGALIISDEPLSISAIELCWEARLAASPQRPIYIMIMSSSEDHNRMIEVLDCGADDFVSKPPVPEEIYARLRAAERLASLQRDLIRLATTDSLTGMFNRRAFFENAKALCARAELGHPLSALMIDIDHFKSINDVYGHNVGDDAICAVAREAMSERAIVGRLGGEEFAMLLDRPMHEAVALAESLRQRMAELLIPAESAPATLTCSFGVSEWQPGDTIDRLLKRADMALYEAKLAGRNRVIAADQMLLVPSYNEAGRPIRSSGNRRSA